MVLSEPGNRIAELVSEPGLLSDLGKNFCCRLFGVARPHQIEAEFHRLPLPLACCATVAAIPKGVKHPNFCLWARPRRIPRPKNAILGSRATSGRKFDRG